MRLLGELADTRRQYGLRKTVQLGVREAKRLVVNQMLRRSYSQAYEDLFAWDLLGRKPAGLYVDVGCQPRLAY